MKTNPPKVVVVEREVERSSVVLALRRNLPHARFDVVDRVSDVEPSGQDLLEVVSFRGRFFKSCPGTRHYHCCGYKILHFGLQCTMDCTYCIMQAYLNRPNLRIFGNTEEMFQEAATELDAHPETLYRIGTGEFTDSLLLDPWTEFSRLVVPFFAARSNAVLELKTKTDHIDNLAGLDHRGRVVAAWSLNAPAIRRREESLTASIARRLEAARRCVEWGYPLAFHFDPMIEHDGWREGYGETLDRLFDAVEPRRIVWISLGAFRFMPELKGIIRSRRPSSPIILGEFIRGLDDKMRYFRDIRVEMYAFMVERIRKADPGIAAYLCMEGEDIWREAMGFSPEEKGGLPAMLDDAVRRRMNFTDSVIDLLQSRFEDVIS